MPQLVPLPPTRLPPTRHGGLRWRRFADYAEQDSPNRAWRYDKNLQTEADPLWEGWEARLPRF